MPLGMAAATGPLLHKKPASREFRGHFILQVNIPHFMAEFHRTDLQLLSRPHTF